MYELIRHLALLAVVVHLSAGHAIGQNRMCRILVAYTPAAADWWTAQGTTPLVEIDLMEDEMNFFLAQSQTRVEMEVVCIHRVSYVESGACGTDLRLFRQNASAAAGDGEMNEVHDLRDEYNADMCMLLFQPGGWTGCSGQAAGIYVGADAAFCIQRAVDMHSNSSVHEFGHLFGCRHCRVIHDASCQPTTCDYAANSAFPAAYCHGYHEPADRDDGWRDIMSNPWHWGTGPTDPAHKNGPVLDFFSNPGIQVGGVNVGTATNEDAARVMEERIDGTLNPGPSHGAVENYRTTPANMTLGAQTIGSQQARLAIARTSITIGNGFVVERGGRFEATVDVAALPKGGPRGGDSPKPATPALAVAENRFGVHWVDGQVNVSYDLVAGSTVTLRVYDVAGRLVRRIELGKHEPGRFSRTIDLRNTARFYLVDIEAGEFSMQRRLIHP